MLSRMLSIYRNNENVCYYLEINLHLETQLYGEGFWSNGVRVFPTWAYGFDEFIRSNVELPAFIRVGERHFLAERNTANDTKWSRDLKNKFRRGTEQWRNLYHVMFLLREHGRSWPSHAFSISRIYIRWGAKRGVGECRRGRVYHSETIPLYPVG